MRILFAFRDSSSSAPPRFRIDCATVHPLALIHHQNILLVLF
jgi:hypothetical protein